MSWPLWRSTSERAAGSISMRVGRSSARLPCRIASSIPLPEVQSAATFAPRQYLERGQKAAKSEVFCPPTSLDSACPWQSSQSAGETVRSAVGSDHVPLRSRLHPQVSAGPPRGELPPKEGLPPCPTV